jgi:hypothetical protein
LDLNIGYCSANDSFELTHQISILEEDMDHQVSLKMFPVGYSIFFGRKSVMYLCESPKDREAWSTVAFHGEWTEELKKAALETYAGLATSPTGSYVPMEGEFKDCEDVDETTLLGYLRHTKQPDYGLGLHLMGSDLIKDQLADLAGLTRDLDNQEWACFCTFMQNLAGRCRIEDLNKFRQSFVNLVNNESVRISHLAQDGIVLICDVVMPYTMTISDDFQTINFGHTKKSSMNIKCRRDKDRVWVLKLLPFEGMGPLEMILKSVIEQSMGEKTRISRS